MVLGEDSAGLRPDGLIQVQGDLGGDVLLEHRQEGLSHGASALQGGRLHRLVQFHATQARNCEGKRSGLILTAVDHQLRRIRIHGRSVVQWSRQLVPVPHNRLDLVVGRPRGGNLLVRHRGLEGFQDLLLHFGALVRGYGLDSLGDLLDMTNSESAAAEQLVELWEGLEHQTSVGIVSRHYLADAEAHRELGDMIGNEVVRRRSRLLDHGEVGQIEGTGRRR